MKSATESLSRPRWTISTIDHRGALRFAISLLGALAVLPGGCGGAPAPAGGPAPATGLVGTWATSDPTSKQQISFAADGTVTIHDSTPGGVSVRRGTYTISGQDLIIEQQTDSGAPHSRLTSPFYQYMDRLALNAYYPQGSHQGLVGTWLNHTVTEILGTTAPTTGDLRTSYLFQGDGKFTSTQVLFNAGMQQSAGTWATVSNEVYSLSYDQSSTPEQTQIYLLDQAAVSTQILYRAADQPSTSP